MFINNLLLILRCSARNYSSTVGRIPQNNGLFKNARDRLVRFAQMSAGDSKDVTYEEVRNLKNNKTVCLIDVREPVELKETGVIPGSINIPLNELESTLKTLTSDQFAEKYQRTKPGLETPLIFSCKAGIRSEKALNIAQNLGYKHVKNYKGGWLDWEKNIKKV